MGTLAANREEATTAEAISRTTTFLEATIIPVAIPKHHTEAVATTSIVTLNMAPLLNLIMAGEALMVGGLPCLLSKKRSSGKMAVVRCSLMLFKGRR